MCASCWRDVNNSALHLRHCSARQPLGTAKTLYSPVTMLVPKTGRPSRPWSKPANSTPSSRAPALLSQPDGVRGPCHVGVTRCPKDRQQAIEAALIPLRLPAGSVPRKQDVSAPRSPPPGDRVPSPEPRLSADPAPPQVASENPRLVLPQGRHWAFEGAHRGNDPLAISDFLTLVKDRELCLRSEHSRAFLPASSHCLLEKAEVEA